MQLLTAKVVILGETTMQKQINIKIRATHYLLLSSAKVFHPVSDLKTM